MNPSDQQPLNIPSPEVPQSPQPQPIAPTPQPLAANPSTATPQQPQLNQPVQPVPTGEDPGRGLAIAGIILAFFASLIGLILSIIARSKSKSAGFDGKLATIGIVLNVIFMIVGFFIIIPFVLITISTLQQIQ